MKYIWLGQSAYTHYIFNQGMGSDKLITLNPRAMWTYRLPHSFKTVPLPNSDTGTINHVRFLKSLEPMEICWSKYVDQNLQEHYTAAEKMHRVQGMNMWSTCPYKIQHIYSSFTLIGSWLFGHSRFENLNYSTDHATH